MKEREAGSARVSAQTAEKDTAEVYFKKQVRYPGLFFCLYDTDEWPETEVFMRKVMQEYPNLRVLIYFAGGKMEPKPAAMHMLVADKTDFNLFGKAKPVLRQWLQGQKFDLLLVFDPKGNERFRKIVAAVASRLKAGWRTGPGMPLTDISLSKPGEILRYDAFYNALKQYLKQLNIRL